MYGVEDMILENKNGLWTSRVDFDPSKNRDPTPTQVSSSGT
jgi:hypothetical protein